MKKLFERKNYKELMDKFKEIITPLFSKDTDIKINYYSLIITQKQHKKIEIEIDETVLSDIQGEGKADNVFYENFKERVKNTNFDKGGTWYIPDLAFLM